MKNVAILCLLLALASGCLTQRTPSAARPQDFTYTTNNGTITITQYTGTNYEVTIPATLDGLPVVNIGQYSFVGSPAVQEVTIPNGVTNIGEACFNEVLSLSKVEIPKSVTNIGTRAFSSCSSLREVHIPEGMSSIAMGTFGACSSLIRAIIPEGVTSIGEEAFCQCSSLPIVTIPKSVTNIGDMAFAYCTSLRGVFFEGDAPSLGTNVFTYALPTVYYRQGTKGWDTTFGGRPTGIIPPIWTQWSWDSGYATNRVSE